MTRKPKKTSVLKKVKDLTISVKMNSQRSLLKLVGPVRKIIVYGMAGAAFAAAGFYGTELLKSLSEKEISKAMINSHVQVVGQRGQGSGVAVKKDGEGVFILTNKHVCLINKREKDVLNPEDDADLIEYAPFVVVKVPGMNKFVGQVMKVGTTVDLCLIHISRANLPIVRLADEDLDYGDVIYNVSSPYGVGAFISKGFVGMNFYIRGTLFRHSTVTTYPGSSGSANFNSKGEVVGLLARGGDPGFSFHVPLSHLKVFLAGVVE